MRKRIRQIARDKFEYDEPCISLPEEELALQVLEGQTYEGSFSGPGNCIYDKFPDGMSDNTVRGRRDPYSLSIS